MPWRLNPFTGKLDWSDVVAPLTTGSVLFADSSGFITQDNSNLFYDDANNRFGIGTNTPRRRLDLLDAASPQLRLSYSDNSVYSDVQTTSAGYLYFNPTGSRIGFNTSSPSSVAHFKGTGTQLSTSYSVVTFEDYTPIADRTDTGGKAEFLGVFNTGGTTTIAGQFGAKKVNQTSGEWGFDMAFSPRRNGSASFEERMRLTSTGKLGIGISNPDARVTVVEETIGNDVFNFYSLTSVPGFVRWNARQGHVSTTDATVTTVCTLPITSSRTYWLRAHVVARRTGGSAGTAEDGAFYTLTGTFKTVGGVVTAIGAATMDFQAEDQAGWNAAFVVSGTNVLVRVTGAVNNNVSWDCTLQYGFINT